MQGGITDGKAGYETPGGWAEAEKHRTARPGIAGRRETYKGKGQACYRKITLTRGGVYTPPRAKLLNIE